MLPEACFLHIFFLFYNVLENFLDFFLFFHNVCYNNYSSFWEMILHFMASQVPKQGALSIFFSFIISSGTCSVHACT